VTINTKNSSLVEILASAPELLEIFNVEKDLREAVRTKLADIPQISRDFNAKINERLRDVTITNNKFENYA
jgi:hypothetical protein